MSKYAPKADGWRTAITAWDTKSSQRPLERWQGADRIGLNCLVVARGEGSDTLLGAYHRCGLLDVRFATPDND